MPQLTYTVHSKLLWLWTEQNHTQIATTIFAVKIHS